MTRPLLTYPILILTLLTLAACGGGSTSTSSASTATVKISLSGTLPANTAIAGAGFTLTLPANVTPSVVSGVVASSVVTPSGTFVGGIAAPAVYTVATGSTAGTMVISLANASESGVTQVGEVATVTLQLANGVAPAAAGFSLSGVSVIDTSGNTVDGMSASVSSVALQ